MCHWCILSFLFILIVQFFFMFIWKYPVELAIECNQFFLAWSVLYYFQVWVETYPTRRYGKPVKGLQDAWWILYHTLYNCTDGKNVSSMPCSCIVPCVRVRACVSTLHKLLNVWYAMLLTTGSSVFALVAPYSIW